MFLGFEHIWDIYMVLYGFIWFNMDNNGIMMGYQYWLVGATKTPLTNDGGEFVSWDDDNIPN